MNMSFPSHWTKQQKEAAIRLESSLKKVDKAPEKEYTTLRVEKELGEEIRERSRKMHCTITQFIELLLEGDR